MLRNNFWLFSVDDQGSWGSNLGWLGTRQGPFPLYCHCHPILGSLKRNLERMPNEAPVFLRSSVMGWGLGGFLNVPKGFYVQSALGLAAFSESAQADTRYWRYDHRGICPVPGPHSYHPIVLWVSGPGRDSPKEEQAMARDSRSSPVSALPERRKDPDRARDSLVFD